MPAQAIQRGGKIATDLVAQKLFQRIEVPGHRDPDPHPVAELARYPLRRSLDLPVFGGLDVFPFRQKVAALRLVRFEIALEIVRLVFQRAQCLDLLAKLDEFRAINLRLLEFTQKFFVSIPDFGLALVPARFCLRNRAIRFAKSPGEPR